jgi:hypothetical protein
MLQFKIFVLISTLTILTLSCNQKQDKEGSSLQGKTSEIQNTLTKKKELVPYSNVYEYDKPYDTTFSNGTYLLYLVNRDTTDLNLYLKYGTKDFDSIYVMEHGVEMSPCHRYEVCYSTEKTIGLVYQCMNSQGLTLLALEKSRPVIEHLNPLFIGAKEGFTISLMDNDNNYENGDSLLVADLDFKTKQYIKIKTLVCGDRLKCFDDVKVKGNKVYFTYTGAIPDADPRIVKQIETITIFDKL